MTLVEEVGLREALELRDEGRERAKASSSRRDSRKTIGVWLSAGDLSADLPKTPQVWFAR